MITTLTVRRLRQEKAKQARSTTGWLATYSDLGLLLLTMFIMLFSMSFVESSFIERISSGFGGSKPVFAKLPPVDKEVKILADLLSDPKYVAEHEQEIKELLFPANLLPPGLDRVTILENVMIIPREEGMAIVLLEQLMFAEGTFMISAAGHAVLVRLAELLAVSHTDVQISGHVDDGVINTKFAHETGRELASGIDGYVLSGRRALAVLGVFIENDLNAQRFSVSAYGADRPLIRNSGVWGTPENRRVEILLQTVNTGLYQ